MDRPMRFLVVEDDHLQAPWIVQQLRIRYGFQSEIEVVETECDFRHWLARQHSGKPLPDVVVMDIMLNWCHLRECEDSLEDTFPTSGVENAGFRCRQLLAKKPLTAAIPVVYYSVFDRSDLAGMTLEDEHTTFVCKDSRNLVPLYDAVKRLTEVHAA